jgi:hypothetical protein
VGAPTAIDRAGRAGLKPPVRDDVIVNFLEALTVLAGGMKRRASVIAQRGIRNGLADLLRT